MNILFLCTGNSARSILAEAVTNHLAQGRVRAFSAGSFPKGEAHPLALDVLSKHGISSSGLRSKSWNEFLGSPGPPLDVVITLCDSAANEVCPVWSGTPLKVHWGIPDPAAIAGSDIEQRRAFERAYTTLERRITLFLALPVEYLKSEQTRKYLQEIGEATP